MKGWRRWLRRSILVLLLGWGTASGLTCIFLAAGRSPGFERWLNVTSDPTPADAIVCIGGGTMDHDLPTAGGWVRIHTSVQLFADGYAPVVVFTGRGSANVSEAEVYADAAKWLGLPGEAIALDPLPASTAEHPAALLTSGARLECLVHGVPGVGRAGRVPGERAGMRDNPSMLEDREHLGTDAEARSLELFLRIWISPSEKHAV